MRQDAMIFIFWMLSFKPSFSLSSFTFIKRFFNSSSFSAISVVPSVYLRLLVFLYSFDVLLSQFETSPSYNCSLSSCNCCLLTCIQFLRRKVRWSGIPVSLRIFQFVVIHTIKGFGIVNKAEVHSKKRIPIRKWVEEQTPQQRGYCNGGRWKDVRVQCN